MTPHVVRDGCELARQLARRAVPFAVGIDGFSGAGKSTVAVVLSSALDACVLDVDDFYADMPERERLRLTPQQGYERYFDWPRLRETLQTLRDGLDATFDRFDWSSGRGLRPGGSVGARPIVLVEGVYACRPELAALIDVKVFVDTLPDIRRARRRTRRDLAPWPERWDAAEDYYFSAIAPPSSFDVIVSGHHYRSQRVGG